MQHQRFIVKNQVHR